MRKYKVSTPSNGIFTVEADSGTQARYSVANKIRQSYPHLSISAISLFLSARLVTPKGIAYASVGRPKGSFNNMFNSIVKLL